MPSQTDVFTKRVGDHMAPPPPVITADTTVADAIRRMVAAKASSLLVVDRPGAEGPQPLAGILTEQDIVRRVVFKADATRTVDQVMTRPVRTIADSDPLFHGIGRMRKFGLRHMPVVDRTGGAVGILHLHTALALAGRQMVAQIDQLTHDQSLDGLAKVKQAQINVAEQLFADNVPVPDILRLISDVNIDIYRRVAHRALDDMAADGRGRPPLSFAVIVMGSGGRGESSFNADQDNGLVLEDYPDADHDRIDGWFLEFADRVTRMLDQVGLPLCRGNVMATNPLWRKTVSQWCRQMDLWAGKRSRAAIRLGDIFFDFQSVFGDESLARQLRDHVSRRFAAAPAFLRDMQAFQADHETAIGFLDRLRVERSGPHKGRVNLKYRANLPLVETVRLWALREAITETGTRARVRALAAAGRLSADETDALTNAFNSVTRMMLMQQIADYKAQRPVENWLDPKSLDRDDRRALIRSMKAIEAFRSRTRTELTGDIF